MTTSRSALAERPRAEVLVIGGGINGIATFWDLALQGVDVALVERGDYVSGASSASSHMVHGGIRYLENGEFRLVHEAVVERNGLLATAPHMVKPLPTTIPIFSTFSGLLNAPMRFLVTHGRGALGERGAVLIKLGLEIYDTFSRGGRVPRHVFRKRAASLREFPAMTPAVHYTATYYDASMHSPERLALDVLADGIAAGGRASNYLAAVGSENGAVLLRDELSGEQFRFEAEVIVNTSGPWTDLTNQLLGSDTRFMGGTKGSHIVLDHDELLAATGGHEIFFEHSDGRIVLIYPLNGRVLVGTTDINADPRQPVVCTDDEIDYFFELIAHVFPNISVKRSHIVYSFAGIRPLPRHDDTVPGFVSRDYRIEAGQLGEVPTLSLVGGKWTTFRASAEHLSSEVLELLHKPPRTSTVGRSIGGGRGFPQSPAERAAWVEAHRGGHPAELAELLLERYGTKAAKILQAIPVAAEPLSELPGYTAAELAYLAEHEQVVHLADLLLRRTLLAFVGGLSRAGVSQAAEAVAKPLGWTKARIRTEIAETEQILLGAHRVELG